MRGHGVRTPGGNLGYPVRAAYRGPLHRARISVAVRAQTGSTGKGCGKAAPWKTRSRFSTALGNPAKGAGFPLSHSHEGGGPSTLNRPYRVLRKPDIVIC